MIPRILNHPKKHSFFLLGPRGTGKTTWLKTIFGQNSYIDFLNEAVYQEYLRSVENFTAHVRTFPKREFVILDEVQRLPHILNEVHRLIEKDKLKFILTGSSARKLRKGNVNLLAGRALRLEMHPFSAEELGKKFSLVHALKYGHLPMTFQTENPVNYLKSYVGTYLREEVSQEAIVRNLIAFTKSLESLSFSQGQVLNVQNIARDCGVDRKTAESYVSIAEDLLLGTRLPVFTKRAKRKLVLKPKFYFFDVGVYRILRPRGPLDPVDEIEGIAVESLVFQEIRAAISNHELELDIYFYRTQSGQEVDFVLYGNAGFWAIEVKRSSVFRNSDLSGIRDFISNYKAARGIMFYLGKKDYIFDKIQVLSLEKHLPMLSALLKDY